MEFETPNEEIVFNVAQSFYLDKDFFLGADEIGISRINLYFKKKPKFTKNKSGITNPGVSLYLCACGPEQRPNLTRMLEDGDSRREWREVRVSKDASNETPFDFDEPVMVKTDAWYAFLVAFDGDEDFRLWTSKEGDILVGTGSKTAGAVGAPVGKYFEWNDEISASGVSSGRLKALNDTDLKFDVYGAYYGQYFSKSTVTNSVSGKTQTVFTGNVTVNLISDKYEYILYDEVKSANISLIDAGDYIFQNVAYASGTVRITANSYNVTGSANVNFNDLYDLSDSDQFLIVRVNQGTDRWMVRKIQNIVSNTQLTLDVPSEFSNTAASFIISPVAVLDYKERTKMFGKNKDILILRDSNSNTTLRFANNTIEGQTINDGGSGYSNGDVLKVVGTGASYVNASATVTTNSSGGVTSLNWTHNGIGINSSPTYSFANSSGGSSSGSSANITFNIGMSLHTYRANVRIANASVINYDYQAVRWAGNLGKAAGTNAVLTHKYKYYTTGNTYNALQYATKKEVVLEKLEKDYIDDKNIPLLLSWSNRVLEGSPSNIAFNDSILTLVANSSNPWQLPKIGDPDLYVYKFLINNDYTNEHTRYGNAYSKHITTKISFENDKIAEDLLVYLNAYKPVGTNFKVYAKFKNSNDPEAFDDKDWTLLEIKDNSGVFSSASNLEDIKEYTYGVGLCPNVTVTSTGTVTTEYANNIIVGSGTSFNTDFAVKDLIKIWSPLFPNNYFVAVVNSVTNSSQLVLRTEIDSNNVVGKGFKIAKLGYKKQAFVYGGYHDGVLKYYNSAMSEFTGYDTFALKIVILSSSKTLVPEIDDIRAVAVSA